MKTKKQPFIKQQTSDMDLTIVVPIYNEAVLLPRRIKKFLAFFQKQKGISNFEILLCENGSTDKTLSVAQKLVRRNKKLALLSVKHKGIGLALSAGIRKAKYPYIYFNAIDNPFNFFDFCQFKQKINRYDIVFASKNHPNSVYISSLGRRFASKFLSFLIHLFFSLPLTDTQATFLGKKEKILPLLPYCTSAGAFCQTQLALYAYLNNLNIAEVPVSYVKKKGGSKFSLLSDGVNLVKELLVEKLKLYIIKPETIKKNRAGLQIL